MIGRAVSAVAAATTPPPRAHESTRAVRAWTQDIDSKLCKYAVPLFLLAVFSQRVEFEFATTISPSLLDYHQVW